MLRYSVGTLCVFLLCAGFVLSQSGAPLESSNKTNHIDAPVLPSESSSTTNKNDGPVPPSSSETKPKGEVAFNSTTDELIGKPAENAAEKTTSTEKPAASTSSTTSTEKPAASTSSTTSTEKPAASTSSTTSTEKPAASTSSTTSTENPTSTTIPVNPTPGPQKGNWSISEGNSTCIVVEGIFTIKVDYKIKYKSETASNSTTEFVPKFAVASGSCKDSQITLDWKNGTLKFNFKKNDTSKKYALDGIHITLFNIIPGHNGTTYNNATLKAFETPLNQSYSCAATKQFTLGNEAKFTLEEFHLQAFKLSNGTSFDASLDCANSGEHTPDIVPIIVGCVLAALVICVLVAYLVSRRRSQTRGYLSM